MAVSKGVLNPSAHANVQCSTHQLFPQKYGGDCRKYIERFVNQLVVSRSGLLLLDSNAVDSLQVTIKLRRATSQVRSISPVVRGR